MRGSEFMELRVFELVARRKSFSKAADDLGVSRSSITQTIQNLEQRLGVRLLNRTTRSVALTEAGHEFLVKLSPAMLELLSAVDNLEKFRDTPSGTVKLVACTLGAHLYIEPLIGAFTQKYPDITLEITTNDQAPDLISHGFDAAVREEGMIDLDFVALNLPVVCKQCLVASPDFIVQRGTPHTLEALESCLCINVRRFGHGHAKTWELLRGEEHKTVNLGKPLVVNNHEMAVTAALQGAGICLVPETAVAEHLKQGRLVCVFPEWRARLPNFKLCYPKLNHKTVAFTIFADFIRAMG